MNNPLISVIIPIYNTAAYLPRCIESICQQTYENLEIILVDDGSPDNAPAICDEYAKKDPRIKVIHKNNGGLSSARNAGIDAATGDYLSFIDSDDFVKPEMYERMAGAVTAHGADVCLCRCITYDENGQYGKSSVSSGNADLVLTGVEMQEKLVKDGAPKYVIACNKLISSRIFQNHRFVEGKQHEDEFFAHHLYGSCGSCVIIDDILYVYQIRSDSIMHEKVSAKRLDAVDALIDRVRYLCCRGERELALCSMSGAVAKFAGTCAQLTERNVGDKERIAGLEKELWKVYKEISGLSAKESVGLAVKLGLMKPRIAAKRIITMASSARKR